MNIVPKALPNIGLITAEIAEITAEWDTAAARTTIDFETGTTRITASLRRAQLDWDAGAVFTDLASRTCCHARTLSVALLALGRIAWAASIVRDTRSVLTYLVSPARRRAPSLPVARLALVRIARRDAARGRVADLAGIRIAARQAGAVDALNAGALTAAGLADPVDAVVARAAVSALRRTALTPLLLRVVERRLRPRKLRNNAVIVGGSTEAHDAPVLRPAIPASRIGGVARILEIKEEGLVAGLLAGIARLVAVVMVVAGSGEVGIPEGIGHDVGRPPGAAAIGGGNIVRVGHALRAVVEVGNGSLRLDAGGGAALGRRVVGLALAGGGGAHWSCRTEPDEAHGGAEPNGRHGFESSATGEAARQRSRQFVKSLVIHPNISLAAFAG